MQKRGGEEGGKAHHGLHGLEKKGKPLPLPLPRREGRCQSSPRITQSSTDWKRKEQK